MVALLHEQGYTFPGLYEITFVEIQKLMEGVKIVSEERDEYLDQQRSESQLSGLENPDRALDEFEQFKKRHRN